MFKVEYTNKVKNKEYKDHVFVDNRVDGYELIQHWNRVSKMQGSQYHYEVKHIRPVYDGVPDACIWHNEYGIPYTRAKV